MKRTEKVEIRVSLEEKQTLTALAKQDGESVSGLIRRLVEKYMALNTASTVRKLPKWKIAAGLILAAFVGHGLTLIPMHLHDRGHEDAALPAPVYMVHGAIDNSAFGVSLHTDDRQKDFTLNSQSENPLRIRLNFTPNSNDDSVDGSTNDGGGLLELSICELSQSETCEDAFETEIKIERIVPSVLGNSTKTGKSIHIFVQEMA